MNKEGNKNFEKEIQRMLDKHTMPVDSQIWNNIEKRITKPTRKRVIPLWWWTSGAVAAILIIAFLIFPVQQKEKDFIVSNNPTESINKKEQSISSNTNNKIKKVENHIDLNKKIKEKRLQRSNNKVKRNFSPAIKKKTLAQNNISNINKRKNRKPNIKNQDIISIEKTENKIKKERTEKIQKKEIANNKKTIKIQNLADWDKNNRNETKKKKEKNIRNRILLTALFSAERGNQSQQNSTINFHNSQPLMYKSLMSSHIPIESSSVILSASEYSKHRHLPPISLGLMIETRISKNWSLETGLVYTYLRSEYSRPGNIEYRGTQQLHYLGIPINIKRNLFNGNNWNIYLSVGQMGEKGIHSVYTQDIITNYKEENIKVTSVIDGLQWSLNGSLGFQMKLNKNINLFIEPKCTYYLKNNQPMSARTENPIQIGINGGIRFGL